MYVLQYTTSPINAMIHNYMHIYTNRKQISLLLLKHIYAYECRVTIKAQIKQFKQRTRQTTISDSMTYHRHKVHFISDSQFLKQH